MRSQCDACQAVAVGARDIATSSRRDLCAPNYSILLLLASSSCSSAADPEDPGPAAAAKLPDRDRVGVDADDLLQDPAGMAGRPGGAALSAFVAAAESVDVICDSEKAPPSSRGGAGGGGSGGGGGGAEPMPISPPVVMEPAPLFAAGCACPATLPPPTAAFSPFVGDEIDDPPCARSPEVDLPLLWPLFWRAELSLRGCGPGVESELSSPRATALAVLSTSSSTRSLNCCGCMRGRECVRDAGNSSIV